MAAFGSMVSGSSTFSLPRQHLVGIRGYRYGYSSPCYRRGAVVAVNSSRNSPSQPEGIDPFSLVANELSILADRLRAMDEVEEVPALASAVQYFFKPGREWKRFRPTVLLLMATALGAPDPESPYRSLRDTELRRRQQLLAEITEMIHVGSLKHDDVLDDADTRRGIETSNAVMGNKFSLLAGDLLLSRACTALASLNNAEGIVTAPMLFAIEEYPHLREVVERGVDDPAAVGLALEYLGKSSGIQKAKDLAKKHADLAVEAIDALPFTDDDTVRRSRRALIDLTNIVITRTR